MRPVAAAGPTLAWRWLRREWRGGELPLLALAVTLAVASVSAVGFFADRVHRAMSLRATELLAADVVLVSPAAIPEARRSAARERGLAVAETLTFPSMVSTGDRLQLAEVKAVGPGYPLRGELRVAPAPFAPDTPRAAGPEPGTVWVDARLATALGVGPGDRLQIGAVERPVAAVLSYEPDRPGDLFTLGPRLMMHLDDVPATALVQPGSRVTHRLLVAGSETGVADFREALEGRLTRGESLQGVRDTRPELRVALDRAERFLGLAALVSALLAGVAVALAARRYAERHLDTAAILRCLGATQARVTGLFATQLLLVGAIAATAGVAIGYLAQAGLAALLAEAYPGPLPLPSPYPALAGAATGLVTLAGFALPPLLRLREVPPLRVLRRDLAPLPARARAVYGSALLALGALVLWQAADARLAAYVLAAAGATVVVLVAAAYALVSALRPLRGRVGVSWRFGLARIARRPGQSVVQVAAFGLGLMVLLLLTLVRGELIEGWRDRLPPDTPNYFLINVQPDEVAGVRAFLSGHGVAEPALYPMVRGRLAAIDGRPVSAEDYEGARAKRLVEREFNLSGASRPQGDNRIVAGTWWKAGETALPQFSVEEGLAGTLGVTLGSRLRFQVAGQEVEAPVTSLRTVQWDSFRVNFFVVTPPGVLDGFPTTYVTSFHLPPERPEVLSELVRAFPSVTVLDVEAILSRVRHILEQAALAVQYVFLFALLAGVTVLAAAVQSTLDERRFESAVLRTLGADRRRLLAGLLAEFATLGALAGLLASVAAAVTGVALARAVFDLDYVPGPGLWLSGVGAGLFGVALAGYLGTRRVLSHPPMESLRAG